MNCLRCERDGAEAATRICRACCQQALTSVLISRAAELEYVEIVMRWSEMHFGRRPDPSLVCCEGETFDSEVAAENTFPRLMTPYRAGSITMRNEERAFAF